MCATHKYGVNPRRRPRLALAVSILTWLWACGSAQAQQPPPDPNAGQRPDGRIEPEEEPSAVPLALPRLLLLPFRGLILGLAYPLGALANFVENHHVLQWLKDTTTTSDGKRGVRINFDFRAHFTPSAGLTYYDQKSLGPDSTLEVRTSVGDKQIAQGGVYLRPLPKSNWTQIDGRFDFLHRNDQYFDGGGPVRQLAARYKVDALTAVAGIHRQLARPVFVDVTGESGWKRFGEGRERDEGSPIGDVFCVRVLGRCLYGDVDNRLVPGFDKGTQYLRGGAAIRIDTNERPVEPQSGFFGGLGVDYTHGIFGDDSSYFRIRPVAGVVIDLWQRSHTLVLRASAVLIEPIGHTQAPFSEVPALGDPDALRGFILGSLRDQSQLVYRAEYRFPIWMYSDAFLFADYGGVYHRNFGDFSNRRTYWDLGIGLRAFTQSLFIIHIGLAYGFSGGGWQFYIRGDK
jgi:hypothetical protein